MCRQRRGNAARHQQVLVSGTQASEMLAVPASIFNEVGFIASRAAPAGDEIGTGWRQNTSPVDLRTSRPSSAGVVNHLALAMAAARLPGTGHRCPRMVLPERIRRKPRSDDWNSVAGRANVVLIDRPQHRLGAPGFGVPSSSIEWCYP